MQFCRIARAAWIRRSFTKAGKYKVLWLLHGGNSDDTAWQRKTMIEVCAKEKNLIVVMPEAHNSFHTNWPEDPVLGYNMYDYFFSERMPAIHNRFPASDKPEDNFIAGNFMGGPGTIKFCGRTIRKICGCGGVVRSAGGFYPACRRQLCRKHQSPVYPRQPRAGKHAGFAGQRLGKDQGKQRKAAAAVFCLRHGRCALSPGLSAV